MIAITVKLESAEDARKLESTLAALGYEYTLSGLDAAAQADRTARIHALAGFEREVFDHFAKGRDFAGTAAAMAVSRTTVARFAGNLVIRLGLGSVDEVIAVARGVA